MTASQIKYRGQLYVLADTLHRAVNEPEPVVHVSPHERCATGTHWNEEQKKCLPLPPELARKRQQAQALTEKARGVSHSLIGHGLEPKDAPRGTVHKTAIGYHQDGIEAQRAARNAHADLQDLAYEHGFNELSQHHEQRASRHHERMRRHKQFLQYIDAHPNIAHPLFADDPEHR